MNLPKIRLSSGAHEDYASLIEYYLTTRGIEITTEVDEMLERVFASLNHHPDRGRMVPELRDRGFPQFREIIASPYRVVYHAQDHEVWIIAIVDGRRDLEELLYERARRAALE